MVRLSKIYTKTGDTGTPALVGGDTYSGSRVDCQATICHCPPLLT
jgi:cob(I)alamin adenosyltransferase